MNLDKLMNLNINQTSKYIKTQDAGLNDPGTSK